MKWLQFKAWLVMMRCKAGYHRPGFSRYTYDGTRYHAYCYECGEGVSKTFKEKKWSLDTTNDIIRSVP